MNKNLILLTLAIALLNSCSSDSVTDEFNEANGNVEKRFISSVDFKSNENSEENKKLLVNYDNDDKVSTASNLEGSVTFSYENDDISTIGDENESVSMSEFYQDPYDAFEIGEVLEYDNNGNPFKILIVDEYYDYETDEIIEERIIAELSYDNKPNSFFYTLEAAGLIEAMDQVSLSFNPIGSSADIKQARMLFPLNNLTHMEFTLNDEIISEVSIDYVYDGDYPSSATIEVSEEEEEEYSYALNYEYK